MHLWPSATIRNSFKLDYLRKLEWNLDRMKRDKQSSLSANQKLLEEDDDDNDNVPRQQQQGGGQVNGKVTELPNSKTHLVVLGVCQEALMLLSCCFCCFCCGACANEEADPVF